MCTGASCRLWRVPSGVKSYESRTGTAVFCSRCLISSSVMPAGPAAMQIEWRHEQLIFAHAAGIVHLHPLRSDTDTHIALHQQ